MAFLCCTLLSICLCCLCHSQSSAVSTTDGKNSVEHTDSKPSALSMCTPSRRKLNSQTLRPRIQSTDDEQSLKIVDSKLALTSFCTPSRAKSVPKAQRDRVPHPHSTSLPLPHSYYVLGELFQSADTIVSWLTNRAEICTFDKLKSAVQDMTKRYECDGSFLYLRILLCYRTYVSMSSLSGISRKLTFAKKYFCKFLQNLLSALDIFKMSMRNIN